MSSSRFQFFNPGKVHRVEGRVHTTEDLRVFVQPRKVSGITQEFYRYNINVNLL